MDIISREAEINKMSDEDIIKSVDHKSNYAIVDKKNKKLTVYSPSGDILYSTNNIGVGASGDDYNTYTKTTKDKKLIRRSWKYVYSGRHNKSVRYRRVSWPEIVPESQV